MATLSNKEITDIKKTVKKEAEDEAVKTGLYLTPHPMMGYDPRYIHFIFCGARGRGKSVLALDAPIASCEKYGYENNKIFFFRLADTSIKQLLAGKASNLVDPILVDKYKMDISKKANVVYNHGKKLLEVYSLISAPKNKGLALYDANFLNNRPIDQKTGKPVKRFIWLILDEFQIAEGLEKSSAASRSTAALWKMYTEIILRDQQFLDYSAVKCLYLANSVAECSTFTSEMWGYYMPPGDFRIKKCPLKNAVFFNVPNSKQYINKRKQGMTGSITNFDDDSNYSNEVKMDMEQIKPKKTRLYKVTNLIKFDKLNKSAWFCIYDSQYIRQYHGETVNKYCIIGMKRHIDEKYNQELVNNIFELYDAKAFKYADVISLANFRARMKELKAK